MIKKNGIRAIVPNLAGLSPMAKKDRRTLPNQEIMVTQVFISAFGRKYCCPWASEITSKNLLVLLIATKRQSVLFRQQQHESYPYIVVPYCHTLATEHKHTDWTAIARWVTNTCYFLFLHVTLKSLWWFYPFYVISVVRKILTLWANKLKYQRGGQNICFLLRLRLERGQNPPAFLMQPDVFSVFITVWDQNPAPVGINNKQQLSYVTWCNQCYN